MRRVLAIMMVMLAGCDGAAPMVQSPNKALNHDSGRGPCIANEPPALYRGPVSPYSGSCAESAAPNVVPGGSHDYSTGMPSRAVR
jgi:hypothetical protein